MRNLVVILVLISANRSEVFSQPKVDMALKDSIDLSASGNYLHSFQMLQERTPLVAFSQGIYMPYEKMWFYRVSNNTQLKSFAVSHTDTSLHLLLIKGDKRSIVRIQKKQEQQTEESFPLPVNGDAIAYPCTGLNYYILSREDGKYSVYYVSSRHKKKILTTVTRIVKVVPIDHSEVLLLMENDLVLLRAGSKPKRVFSTDAEMYDMAVDDRGRMFVSTAFGVFLLDESFTVAWSEKTISDGKLIALGNTLYVMSVNRKTIYVYQ